MECPVDSVIGPKRGAPAQYTRHRAIADFVMKRGSVSIDDLAEHTGVSAMTIYRDVSALEEAGLVQRHRGQVTPATSSLQEASASFRVEQDPDAKSAMARLVAGMVPTGSSILLDDSTSGVYVVRELARKSPMTIITNSLLIAREVAQVPELHLFVTGGSYQGWADALLGPTAIVTIQGLDPDFCVLSASGIAQGRCFHPYEDVVAVKRAMLDQARTRVLLLDHTKLARKALHAFARLDEFDHVVVDAATPKSDLDQLREWGARVTVAPA